MNYTQSIGCHVELQCMDAFVKLGHTCSIPYGNDAKYDFVADIDGKLIRVQCKSPHLIKERHDDNVISSIMLNLSTSTTNTKGTVRRGYDKTQIDYYATFYNGITYLIPIEDVKGNTYTLRLKETLNDQYYSSHMAEDYVLEKIIDNSKEYNNTKIKYLDGVRERKKISNNKTNNDNILKCKICGREISKGTRNKYCLDCWNKHKRKVERPSKEELERLIYEKPFTRIAEDYGVTDNAVRRWCISYGLPHRKRDINK